jgi:hypothetical protein
VYLSTGDRDLLDYLDALCNATVFDMHAFFEPQHVAPGNLIQTSAPGRLEGRMHAH